MSTIGAYLLPHAHNSVTISVETATTATAAEPLLVYLFMHLCFV